MDSIIVHSSKYTTNTNNNKTQNYPNLGIGARSISVRRAIANHTVCCTTE
jgi:hypothetical protein